MPATPAPRRRLARLKPLAAAVAFGEPYPHRVTRTMVLARLANLLGGHGMATPRLVEELVGMLNRGPIPCVPRQGQGGPGEILVLYTLFAELSRRIELQAAERGALINGSPASAAVLADAALSAERRIEVAEQVLALAIEAFKAPVEHYETVLGELLGGEHHRRAFSRLAALLDGATDCGEARPHQAPVSYRIVPQVLAQAHAAIGFARGLAAHSLSAVTHNPVWLAPDEAHPRGRCLSTGGYHNSVAVSAHCEVVLEGVLAPDETVEEGPVSEFHGMYERYGAGHVVTFSQMTRRRDAVSQCVLPGYAGEHIPLGAEAIAAGLRQSLHRVLPSVREVAVTAGGAGRLHAVVSLAGAREGAARRAIFAVWAAVSLVKQVTVVDGDVDPWDPIAVEHAVATRMRPDRDLIVVSGVQADRAEPLEKDGLVGKLGIDATAFAPDRSDWTRARPPQALLARIREKIAR